MSYSVKQGSIFGRIGTELGKGLAEQIPKEAERTRLSQGLQSLAQEKNLTPFEQFSRLSSIPGVTPQMIQSGSELLKQQAQANAYKRAASRSMSEERAPSNQQVMEQAENIPFAGINSSKRSGEKPYGTQKDIVQDNPTNSKFLEKQRWTPERRNQEIAQILDSGITTDPSIAAGIANQNEQAELAAPGIEKTNQSYLQGVEQDVRDEFTRQIEKATQKKGNEIYSSLTGETLLGLEKGVRRDLALNPNANKQEVVERWIKKGLDLAKTRPLLNTLAERDAFDFLTKHKETMKRLGSYQKIYKDAGAQEEFYNKLKMGNTPAEGASENSAGSPAIKGFQMSPQGAAQQAFPRNEPIKNIVSQHKRQVVPNANQAYKNAVKTASEVAKHLDDDSSILAIGKDLRDRDPFFDQTAFFDYFRDPENNVRLNSMQERQMGEAGVQYLPAWGDEWINFRGF